MEVQKQILAALGPYIPANTHAQAMKSAHIISRKHPLAATCAANRARVYKKDCEQRCRLFSERECGQSGEQHIS